MPASATHATIVGAGPAGLAPLLAGSRDGTFQALLQAGLTIVERSDRIGLGRIGRYAIESDGSADTYLSCVRDHPMPRLAALAGHPMALAIASCGSASVPLELVGRFQALLGETLRDAVTESPDGRVLTRHEAIHTRRTPRGGWSTRIRCLETETEHDVVSNVVLLSTGAEQPDDRLAVETVGGAPLLPRHRDRLIQSDEALTRDGVWAIEHRLQGVERPRIAVIGGSASALACARLLLASLHRPLSDGAITILHRRPLTPFHASVAAAEGYEAFASDDICSISGLRFESRELPMRVLQIGDRPAEPRVALHRLRDDGGPDMVAQDCLETADVVIACLGYRPRALPVLDVLGRPIPLMGHQPDGALVGGACGVLDAEGREIDGLFGLGLAAGLRLPASLGGEASHRGQVDGLRLWQNEIGALIAGRMRQAIPPPPVFAGAVSTLAEPDLRA